MADAHLLPDRILFGAAYYAEYRVNGDLERDLDLMARGGLHRHPRRRVGLVDMGAAATGVFNLDWLQPVLDGAHARGISRRSSARRPTRCPRGCARRTPRSRRAAHRAARSAGERARRSTSRTRCSGSYAERRHPGDRRAVRRPPRGHRLPGRQRARPVPAAQPATSSTGSCDWLRSRYGDVETLNAEWGLTYWSHRLARWARALASRRQHSAAVPPRLAPLPGRARPPTSSPGRPASCASTRDAGQFVTTCISLRAPGASTTQSSCSGSTSRPATRTTGCRTASRTRSRACRAPRRGGIDRRVGAAPSRATACSPRQQAPFLVTETNAQSIGSPDWQHQPPYPGQIALSAASLLVARGARMIEYWHWHTLHYGIETYWGGVLPHSGRPGRIYREIAELGRPVARPRAAARGVHARRRCRPALLDRHRSTASSSTRRSPTPRAARIARRTCGSSIATTARPSRRASRVGSCTPTSSGERDAADFVAEFPDPRRADALRRR